MDRSPSNSLCACGRGWRVRWLRWACDDALRAVFPANICLMKCDNLKALADPCIDCELMIILIDLILQKTRAYHHILFNKLSMWDYLLTRYESMMFRQINIPSSLVFLLAFEAISLLNM
ncbi:hypothetical protein PVAP13_2KG559701 [Panicum virgatum]|uniref:Protein ARV n=1 Tax=Panicum virgatum TaxID=38727 RepID=A0A8T0WM55_PANVG|nr:hypothetical protein PVAP13_2KG559701 [Panicum virgatum]